MNMLVLLVALAALYSVDALRCKSCMYMKGTSDNDIMTLILESMTSKSQDDCTGDADKAPESDCGKLPPGKDAWRCGKGDISTTLIQKSGQTSLRADLDVVSRGCAPVDSTDEKYSVGCHPAEDYKDEFLSGLGQEGGPTMGKLSGHFCICDGDKCNTAVGHSPVLLLVLALASAVFFLKQ